MSKVIQLGLGPTAKSALMSLTEKMQVIAVVRTPLLAKNGQDEVISLAMKLGIKVETDISIVNVERIIEKYDPDCVVVSSYNRIISNRLLTQRPFVNVHYAPLPQYRGRANVNWALINGENTAAISIHYIVAALDAGNILFQEIIPIRPRDTVNDLYERLNEIQRCHLGDVVCKAIAGEKGMPQDNSHASYGCTRIPEDGNIDWSESVQFIDRLIRALVDPFPGAFTYLNGRKLFVWSAEPLTDVPYYKGGVPGRIVGFSKEKGCVDVLTGDGVLRLFEVQYEGEERVSASQVIRSVKVTLGIRIGDLLSEIRRLETMIKSIEINKGKNL